MLCRVRFVLSVMTVARCVMVYLRIEVMDRVHVCTQDSVFLNILVKGFQVVVFGSCVSVVRLCLGCPRECEALIASCLYHHEN